ncbi:MAG: hypothetical protein WBM66_15335, partial [Thiothrix litoralis]
MGFSTALLPCPSVREFGQKYPKWKVGNACYALLAMALRKILWDFDDFCLNSPILIMTDYRNVLWRILTQK